jgi:hypothetical protein
MTQSTVHQAKPGNAHFPITVKVGDRFQWYAKVRGVWQNGNWVYEDELRTSPKTLLTTIDAEHHHPTLNVVPVVGRYSRSGLEGTLRCSCGHDMDVSLTGTGRLSSRDLRTWNGHRDTLAAPLKVWEGSLKRTTHSCYVVTWDQLVHHLGWQDTRAWGKYITRFSFHVARVSSINGAVKYMNSANSIADAVSRAQQYGIAEQGKGTPVTWFEDPILAEVSTGVGDLLTTMQRAESMGEVVNAIKLADEYLGFVDPIRAKRQQLQKRVDELLSFGND